MYYLSKRVKDLIDQGFPAIYLAMICIIQGVALGIFINNVFINYGYNGISLNFISYIKVRFILYSFLSFMVIALISYEYSWYVLVFRYPMRIYDILIPFTLGFLEVAPTFYLMDQYGWWFWISITSFFAVISYSYSIYNCEEKMFPNKYSYEISIGSIKRNRIFCFFFGIVIALPATMLSFKGLLFWYVESIFLLFALAWQGILICSEERFLKKFYKSFESSDDEVSW
jgi:hypothetical protein